ncbi:MAG: PAS domain S-box protein [Alphaproteobacteria bacterium]|nr:MAG: PAS domain S-box protein [Alphaproteobacteria bacterium]
MEIARFSERFVRDAPDAIIYADAQGLIQFWNRSAERIFGFSEAEALGKTLDIIIPESLRGRHWQGYRATMQTGNTRYGVGETLAVPAMRKDRQRISIEFTILPFRDDAGRMVGIAAILRDVTARFEETRALRRQLAQGSTPPPAPAAG